MRDAKYQAVFGERGCRGAHDFLREGDIVRGANDFFSRPSLSLRSLLAGATSEPVHVL